LHQKGFSKMIHSEDDRQILKQRQLFLMGGIGILALILVTLVLINKSGSQTSSIRSFKFDLPTDQIDPTVMRMQNLESKLQVSDLENTQLKNTLADLLKTTKANQELVLEQFKKQNTTLTHQIDQKIAKEKEAWQQEIQQKVKLDKPVASAPSSTEKSQHQAIASVSTPAPDEDPWHTDPVSSKRVVNSNALVAHESPSQENLPKKVTRTLVAIGSPTTQNKKKKFLDDSIPMGESVKAILLSGVDAVCGVYSKSEPVPVKLQLLEQGQLPNKMYSKVKRAVIIGSAHGDISSERIIIRLEKLRTLNLDGSYYDTAISGFVTGEDGKYGVRGKVVDRSVKMIRNAATAGVLEEVSNLAQASLTKPATNVSSWSAAPQALGGGVVGGSSRALEMMADYYIKRAEHVQPVLQVGAGRIVDITFSSSVEIGDLDVKERLSYEREQARIEEYHHNS
jgi:conjugal transfer pilus assembly protein TraB